MGGRTSMSSKNRHIAPTAGQEWTVKTMTLEKAIELIRIEYANALKLKHIKKPLAYALYQVWKIADKSKSNKQ